MQAMEKEKQIKKLEKELSALCQKWEEIEREHWDFEYNYVPWEYRGEIDAIRDKCDHLYSRIEQLKTI